MGAVDGKCSLSGKDRLTRRAAMARARWFRRTRFARMHHYRCSGCGFWHVGNTAHKPAGRR